MLRFKVVFGVNTTSLFGRYAYMNSYAMPSPSRNTSQRRVETSLLSFRSLGTPKGFYYAQYRFNFSRSNQREVVQSNRTRARTGSSKLSCLNNDHVRLIVTPLGQQLYSAYTLRLNLNKSFRFVYVNS